MNPVIALTCYIAVENSRCGLALLLVIACISQPLPIYAAPKSPILPTPFQTKPGERHAFYGQVKDIDHAHRTITVSLGMRFTFQVPAATPITVRRSGAVGFDAIKPGAGVLIVARRGAGSWTADKITLEPGATFPDEPSATTAQGQTITGSALVKYITYEPPGELFNRNINFGKRSGLYALSIRPDGTVASVRAIKSMGVAELDERSSTRLMKTKFRPGTLREARIPVSVSSFRSY